MSHVGFQRSLHALGELAGSVEVGGGRRSVRRRRSTRVPRLRSGRRRPWRHGAADARVCTGRADVGANFRTVWRRTENLTARRNLTCIPTGATCFVSNSRRAVSAHPTMAAVLPSPALIRTLKPAGCAPPRPRAQPLESPSSSSSSSPSQTNPSSLTRVPSRTHAGPAAFASAPPRRSPVGSPSAPPPPRATTTRSRSRSRWTA